MAVELTCPHCFEQFKRVPEPDKNFKCPTCGAEVPRPAGTDKYTVKTKSNVKCDETKKTTHQGTHSEMDD
jgi:PHP family Zn ribbon phosphoesterase